METGGRDTNRPGHSGVDNVVPFPRDWIGPLDDLVPIGTSASSGPEDEEIADAFAADAFWSEGSASLHQVIEAPAGAVPEEAAAPGEPPVVEVDAGRSEHRPVGERRVLWRPRSHTKRFRWGTLGFAGLLAVAAAALAVEIGPAVGRHAVAAAGAELRGADGAGGATSTASNESARLSRLLVARAIEGPSRSSGGSRRSVAHRHGATHRTTAASSSRAASSHVNVSYVSTPTTTTAPSAATTTPSETSTTQPSDESGTSAQTNTSSASGGGSSSGGSGPVGAGAPFGPGQMTGG